MICRPVEGGWEIVFQRNHALLAAQMLVPWQGSPRPEPWLELCNACAHHDHGWNELDGDARVDDRGQPVDFLHTPLDRTLAMSRRNLRSASAVSQWCAILVARHAEYLYSSKNDPETDAYLAEVKAHRRQQMEKIGASDERVETLYELLQWADSLSLLVCCPPSDFTRSLPLKAAGRNYQATRIGTDRWTLNPWPYAEAHLELHYETRTLAGSSFADDEELGRALREAPVDQREVDLRPG